MRDQKLENLGGVEILTVPETCLKRADSNFLDPTLCRRLLLLQQTDVTGRATAEGALSDLTDSQLAMLSQVHALCGDGLMLWGGKGDLVALDPG